MDEVIKITNDIKSGNIKPIYFLMGEEPYYIDKLTDFIADTVLTEDEKEFNQVILYGKDTSIEDILSNAKRYPMMADRQVVIVKEAQELVRTIDKIEAYVKNPQPTTVLVFAYKYKTLDKRKAFLKEIAKNGVLFQSKKLYDNQVPDWIKRVLSGKGYSIEPKAAIMLGEFLGTDLSKINNELEKLKIILPKGHTITAKDIEENIGISKDYNIFELRNAIGKGDQLKAYKIIEYFGQNQKDNPFVLVVTQLFSYFIQLLQYHGLKDKSKANVVSVLNISPYFVSDYDLAAKRYPMKKVSSVIAKLRELDVKGKGVEASAISPHDLMKEMLFHIFN